MEKTSHKSIGSTLKAFGRPIEICAVAVLLSIHLILAFNCFTKESPTFDEPIHLAGGMNCWLNGDYSFNPENGIFPQRWAALPLAAAKFKFPGKDSKIFENQTRNELCSHFLYSSGNNPDKIMLYSRTAMLALSLALGLAVYLCSREIFGTAGAMFSLFLYCLCPTILANAGLVTSDIPAALGFILSVWFFWKLLHRLNIWNLFWTSAGLSILFLSKFSAFIIVPVLLILVMIRLMARKPLLLILPGRFFKLRSDLSQVSAFLSALLICAFLVIFSIWLFFGFKYPMQNVDSSEGGNVSPAWAALVKDTGKLGILVDRANRLNILPEPYTYGFLFTMKHSFHRYSFLNGEYSYTGWWYFFPYSFLVKTPLPLMALILILACVSFTGRFGMGLRKNGGLLENISRNSYALAPFLALGLIYCTFAISSRMNIGHRHILPIYPLIYICAGSAALAFMGKSKLLKILVLILAAGFAFESFKIRPHYLAYFNQIVGGPENAYRHLVDSSLDWGQDLKGLKEWIEEDPRQTENYYLSYFGTASIKQWKELNMDIKKLPCYEVQKENRLFILKEGTYCISATMLQMVYLPDILYSETGINIADIDDNLYSELLAKVKEQARDFSYSAGTSDTLKISDPLPRNEFTKIYRQYEYLRFLKLCLYLMDKKPDGNVGYSILIFRLTEKDLKKALEIN